MALDPRTAFAILLGMTLLNGAVLGLMHRSLSPDVRPAAADWRVGTLLLAGGSTLLALQDHFAASLVLPLANGIIFWGLALYWRSIRRFHGLRDTRLLYAPGLLAVVGIYWFAAVTPNLTSRVLLASIAWFIPSFAAGWTLLSQRMAQPAQSATGGGALKHPVRPAGRPPISNAVLAGILFFVAAFMLARAAYFVGYGAAWQTVMDYNHWINTVTPMMLAVLPIIGTTAFLLMCSERVRRQWELAAATDYLTALPNRRTIMGTGEARFNAARRSGTSFAVAVLDIDHFKAVNDRFGHDTGDAVLRRIAEILTRECRGPNMVGRQGGEEFVALFEDASEAQAGLAAERLRRAVEAADFLADGAPVKLSVSIGLGVIGAQDAQFADLLRRADQALFAAKAGGRNRVVLSGA
jgi:diguanylate cyclase (GGDEF)-like protein